MLGSDIDCRTDARSGHFLLSKQSELISTKRAGMVSQKCKVASKVQVVRRDPQNESSIFSRLASGEISRAMARDDLNESKATLLWNDGRDF